MPQASAPPGASPADLLIVIEPRQGWVGLGVRELWANRELLYFFVWRDLKVRYKQTFFGAAWAVLQPVLLMAVFSVSLGRIPGVGPSGVPYPLFVFAGLVPWTLFASSLAGASNSLVGAEAIITKVYFPRLLLPLAAVGSFILDFVIALAMLAIMMLVYGAALSPAILLLPFFALLVVVTALGLGTFLAAVNVRYRDVKYVVPFLVQLLLFASPVVYASSIIPEQWRALYALNPMTGALEGFRWAIFGGSRPDGPILTGTVIAILALVGALAYFRRVERTFADVI